MAFRSATVVTIVVHFGYHSIKNVTVQVETIIQWKVTLTDAVER